MAVDAKKTGERMAYLLTNVGFGPGAWRLDQSSDRIEAPGVLEGYREGGWREKVWEHTVGVFDKALATGEGNISQ